MMPVKICGITSQKDAELSIKHGASAIGFIFYKDSLRCMQVNKLLQWIHTVSNKVKTVGVFVNEKNSFVQSVSDKLDLDYIQLHGDESPEYCFKINRPVIKAIRVDKYVDNSIVDDYDVYALLMDTYKKGIPGGTGKSFNWNILSKLKTQIPIILSGGLNANNIFDGIKEVLPAAVDISSGVESSPGEKDKLKMAEVFDIIDKIQIYSNLFKN